MKNLFFLCFLVISLFIFNTSLLASSEVVAFFNGAEDIPLMEGLEQSFNEEFLVFDKPEGRVVFLKAVSGKVHLDKIKEFYFLALPQLGWQKNESDSNEEKSKNKNVFYREKEQLIIMFHIDENSSVVEISITPFN
jgi:hypothetical protein